MNTKKKTAVNVIVGVGSQFIILLLGLIVPRIVLLNYGSDTNGLTNTISQIFTYIALLEAGISVSARNAFYKPIKTNDREQISFVASLAKKYYRKVSIVYFGIIVVASILLPFILKTSITYLTICCYIFFEGLTSVVTFYFINTWTTFLRASGESYIINVFMLISRVLCYGVKIVLSLYSVNIAFIQLGFFVISVIQIFIYYFYMKKKYNWIRYNIDTGNARLPERNSNLISEIAWAVFSSTDMIILSIFVSTKSSSVYSVYNMVFIALNGLLNSVYSSINYHLGLEFNSGNKERYIKIHDAFMSFFVGIISLLMSICYFLIIPFVKLYTRGVTDVNYIYNLLPLFFCLVQMLSWSRYVTGNLIGISFRQKKAIKINIAEAIINLFLSLILVNCIGIEGVILATVIALPLKVIYCTYVSDVIILKRKLIKTVSILGINYVLFFICVFIQYFVHLKAANYLILILYGIFLTIILGIIFVFGNIMMNKDVLKIVKLIRRK